jgi:hypothetical protein
MSVTSFLPPIGIVAAKMKLPFVSLPVLVADPSDSWFLARLVDIKRLMIIRTVYDIEVDHGKDPAATSHAINGLNLCQYPMGVVYVFEQDP